MTTSPNPAASPLSTDPPPVSAPGATGEIQREFTARRIHCPKCSVPMVGARIYNTATRESFVGPVCETCGDAYQVALSGAPAAQQRRTDVAPDPIQRAHVLGAAAAHATSSSGRGFFDEVKP